MNKRLTPDQELERLLDEDGGQFGAIYGRLSRPEPPRRLDRAVLANAARAVHGGRAPRAQRWALAMGSFTGVVLAAGIAWQVGKQMQTNENVPEGSRIVQESRVVPVEAITEPRPRQKSKSDLIMRDADAPPEHRAEAQQGMALPNKSGRPVASAPAEAKRRSVPASSPPSASPDASRSLGSSATTAVPSAAAGQIESEAFPGDRHAIPSESSAPAERVQGVARKSAGFAGGSAGTPESRSAVSGPQAASAAVAPGESSLDKNMRLSPQAWLEEIGRLSSAGQRDLAVENLRLFRSKYPDWPVPEALRQLEP